MNTVNLYEIEEDPEFSDDACPNEDDGAEDLNFATEATMKPAFEAMKHLMDK
jgi:hypothetical protein